MIAHALLAILLASAMAATFVGRRAMDFGITDHGEGAGREQTSQIAITAFADIAEPVLAASRVLPGNEADPGRELAP